MFQCTEQSQGGDLGSGIRRQEFHPGRGCCSTNMGSWMTQQKRHSYGMSSPHRVVSSPEGSSFGPSLPLLLLTASSCLVYPVCSVPGHQYSQHARHESAPPLQTVPCTARCLWSGLQFPSSSSLTFTSFAFLIGEIFHVGIT